MGAQIKSLEGIGPEDMRMFEALPASVAAENARIRAAQIVLKNVPGRLGRNVAARIIADRGNDVLDCPLCEWHDRETCGCSKLAELWEPL